jgi:tetrahydromethanopterin S-methyltransferase subunit C
MHSNDILPKVLFLTLNAFSASSIGCVSLLTTDAGILASISGEMTTECAGSPITQVTDACPVVVIVVVVVNAIVDVNIPVVVRAMVVKEDFSFPAEL